MKNRFYIIGLVCLLWGSCEDEGGKSEFLVGSGNIQVKYNVEENYDTGDTQVKYENTPGLTALRCYIFHQQTGLAVRDGDGKSAHDISGIDLSRSVADFQMSLPEGEYELVLVGLGETNENATDVWYELEEWEDNNPLVGLDPEKGGLIRGEYFYGRTLLKVEADKGGEASVKMIRKVGLLRLKVEIDHPDLASLVSATIHTTSGNVFGTLKVDGSFGRIRNVPVVYEMRKETVLLFPSIDPNTGADGKFAIELNLFDGANKITRMVEMEGMKVLPNRITDLILHIKSLGELTDIGVTINENWGSDINVEL